MSSSNCCFLTCIQISQEAGQVVWYSHLFQNFPQFIVIHSFKGFGIVNKAEVDIFLELSCLLDDPADVGNLISSSSAFFKTSLNIWKFMVLVLLKPGLENFKHYFTSVWDECSCVSLSIPWHCLSLGLEWKLTFSSPVATAEFTLGLLEKSICNTSLFSWQNSVSLYPSSLSTPWPNSPAMLGISWLPTFGSNPL